MTTVTGRLTDYGNAHDFRSVLENRLNAKKSELGETELSLKKFIGSRLGNTAQRVVDGAERLSSFKGRLGPVVSNRGGRNGQPTSERRTSIGSRLGPRVSESLEDDDGPTAKGGSNGFGGEVTGRGSVMSRIVVEQKSREDALAEQKVDKNETQRNRRMFGSILGTLQKFRADENKGKDRELKKRKIEAKIDQKTEQEREDAIRQKKELFEDKRRKEREIKVLQVQMKRVEEFETWERSKRKEQKYIRTKNDSTKIYFLPKHHNDATLTALEDTMDEIDKEIQAARELFEDELLKISARAEQNPNASLDDLEGDDNSGEENDTDRTVTKSIVSAIKKPHTDKFIGTQRKGQEQNDDLKLPYKKQESDVLNGSTGHSKENGDEASEKLECPIIKYEKMKDLEPETGEQEDTRVNEETNGIKNELKENEKAEIKEETNVKGEIEKGHDEPDIPTLKSNIKSDTRKYAEITSPIRVSANNEALSENKTESTDKGLAEKSRSKSPKEAKGKGNQSSSPGVRPKNLSKVPNENDERKSNRKRKNSNNKVEHNKKSRTSKKKKASSDESSSTSSSSDEQSDSDDKSSASNSSSEDSDSSDESSDSHDRKKERKKTNKSPAKNKKTIDKQKVKEFSSVQKRRSRKSRTQASRKASNKKYSDSSDSD